MPSPPYNHYTGSRLQPTTLWLDRLSFRELSRILDEFQRREYGFIDTVLRKVAPRSHDRLVVHHVPFVARLSEEMAQHYVRPPTRSWIGLNEAQASAMSTIYSGLRVDRMMMRLEEQLVTQRTMVGVLSPKTSGPGFVLRLFPPHSVEVDADPLDPESLSAASEIRLKVPVGTRDDVISYGLLRMTPDRIVIQDGAVERGVWTEDGSNPFGGRYPAFVARLGTPAREGDFFASLPEDVAQVQIALSVSLTLTDWIGRYQSWGQAVLTGLDRAEAEELAVGPDTVLGLSDGQQFTWASPPAQTLRQYLEATQKFLEYTLSLNNVSPDLLLKGRSLTALARQMDNLDRETSRRRMVQELQGAEQGLYRALLMALEWGGSVTRFPADSRVEVQYQEPIQVVDPLHNAQAQRMRLEDGLVSPAELVAQERGIPLDEARSIVASNRADYLALKGGADGGQG